MIANEHSQVCKIAYLGNIEEKQKQPVVINNTRQDRGQTKC